MSTDISVLYGRGLNEIKVHIWFLALHRLPLAAEKVWNNWLKKTEGRAFWVRTQWFRSYTGHMYVSDLRPLFECLFAKWGPCACQDYLVDIKCNCESKNALNKGWHNVKVLGWVSFTLQAWFSLGLRCLCIIGQRFGLICLRSGFLLKLVSIFECPPISYPAVRKQLVVKGSRAPGAGQGGRCSRHALLQLVVEEGAPSKPSLPGRGKP